MANPNKNTAKALRPDELESPGGPEFAEEAVKRIDAIRTDLPVINPGDEIKFQSFVKDQPIAGRNVAMFTSLAQQKAPVEEKMTEEYARMKGFPVKFYTKAGRLLEGVLVNWKDNNAFVVVGFDGDTLITKTVTSSELYKIPDNSRLQGAVEFAREHAAELADTRSEISKMLATVFDHKEPGTQAA